MKVHPVCGVQKVWASYAPASNTIILWNGPGTAAAVGYIEGVAPVVHGHWETAIGYDSNRTVICSECRRMNYEPSNYCPHCGAKMDEDEKEDK